jgi:hypothetical protein
MVLIGFLTVVAIRLVRDARAARAEAAFAWAAVDSSKVVLASTKMDRDKYRELAAFAAKVSGKPIAGTRIIVTRWDTVFVHDSVPTTVASDGTRTATFTDSSQQVVVRAEVTAPPGTAPLRATLRVTLPADTPSVGFVRVGTKVVATVKWQGREVRADSPFLLTAPKPPRLQSFLEVLGDPAAATLRGGTSFRVYGGLSAVAAVDQRFAAGEHVRAGAGIRYTF